jgi:hypothetical protein
LGLDRANGGIRGLGLVTPSQTDLVSNRVGNYEYNPQLGVLLDQLSVH